MSIESKFSHGQEVVVFDRKGEYEGRGKVVGIAMTRDGMRYDVQPDRAESLARRICGIPEAQLRRASKPVLAYDRREVNPQHIKDEA